MFSIREIKIIMLFFSACSFVWPQQKQIPSDTAQVVLDSGKSVNASAVQPRAELAKGSEGGIGLGIAMLNDFNGQTPANFLFDLEIRTATQVPWLFIVGNVNFGWTTMEHLKRNNWILCPKTSFHHEYKFKILGAYTGLFLYRTRLIITDHEYLETLSQEEVNSEKYLSRDHIGLPFGIDINWKNILTAQAGVIIASRLPPQFTTSFHLLWPN